MSPVALLALATGHTGPDRTGPVLFLIEQLARRFLTSPFAGLVEPHRGFFHDLLALPMEICYIGGVGRRPQNRKEASQ